MGIGINDIQSSAHSIELKNAAGQALSIDGSGFLTISNSSFAVTATALDIRALTNADVVTIEDGGGSITIDGTIAATQSGTWNVATVTTLTGITNDVNIADGGNSITIDDGGGSITVDGTVSTVAGGYANWKVTAVTVGSTESELVATPLSGRLSVLLQNLSTSDIYLKEATGVTTSNGMLLPKKGYFEAELDDGANLFAIAGTAGNDVRVVEYAA